MKNSANSESDFEERLLFFEEEQFQDSDLEAFAEELRRDPEKRGRLIQHLRFTQGLKATGERRSSEQVVRDRLQTRFRPSNPPGPRPRHRKLPVIRRKTGAPTAPSRKRVSRFGESALKLAAVLFIGAFGIWIVIEFQATRNDGPGPVAPVVVTGPGNEKEPAPVVTVEKPVVKDTPDSTENPSTPPADAPVVAVGKPPAAKPAEMPELSGETTPGESGPALLGWVSQVEGSTDDWHGESEIVTGEHFFEKGNMEFRLTNGVRVTLQAPTRFSLASVDRIRLISGKLAAEVPPSAKGFRVDANDVQVVDLGTRFAVTANTLGDAAVHVYDGSVEADIERAAGEQPGLLRTGDTVRLNLEAKRLDAIPFRAGLFAPPPAWTGSIVEVGRSVNFWKRPPRNAGHNSLPENKVIVFQEQSALTLRKDVAVDLAEPGRLRVTRDRSKDSKVIIPAGTVVATYLVHFDAPGKGSVAREARLRFDSPILGIIFRTDHLFETDRQLGASRTKYPSENDRNQSSSRGIEQDTLEIHEDRRSLDILFKYSPDGDQLRVIVAQDS